MRQDFVIGLALSAVIHGTVFLEGKLFPNRPPAPVVRERPTLTVIDMPPLEPEEPEIVETTSDAVAPAEFAPPMQVDVPQVVTDTSFVQRIQPPPPENVQPNASLVKIPEHRDNTAWHKLQIFDPSSLDQQPVPRVRTPPQYPFEQRRQGVTGEVLVEFIVDTQGNVLGAFAVRSSQREFESAAVQAVSKWKFKPGRRAGSAVNTRMQIPIVFNLDDA
ncbi:energy transducer TonB [Opitutus sp. ER46]|uniref:energy transducer TonB n=1 Tax=Opitutus sp. ER46 TaxID=2161864 RepID=UPI000D30AF75|nr:energy transducer TonB [Opitutus sp. ER46]PTX96533.1 energy transducer TonB [Opitutus sp. ER46]